jgi:hypothetical protein
MASWSLADEWEHGFGWVQDERMQRASHALEVDGRVWLIDAVDDPELEDRVRSLGEPAGVLQLIDRHNRGCEAWARRLAVPHLRAWQDEVPFTVLPIRDRPWWREVALWDISSRTLVVAEALGTARDFCAPGDRLGVHPLVRPFPPRSLAGLQPARIFCGHGVGVHDEAAAALAETLRTARRRLPSALGRSLFVRH